MTEIDKYGRIKNRNFQTQSVTRFPSFNSGYGNFWQRLNRFISNIGEWMADNRDSICTNISIGIYILCWIVFVIGIIGAWINEGFFSALIGGIIGGFIVYYGAAIIMFLHLIVLQIVVRILRLFFYNIYTLLGTIIVAVFLYFYNINS